MSLAETLDEGPRFDSVETFLDWVERQPERWELWDGVARLHPDYRKRIDGAGHMMTGGSPNHARLARNAIRALEGRLEGGPCEAFGGDLAVILGPRRLVYPDASASCEPAAPLGLTSPVVVIEVLSPSTASYDRGDKADAYRRLPSLRHLVLVRQDRIGVQHFHREAALQDFTLTEIARTDGLLALDAIGVAIPLAELYARVDFSG